MAKSAHEHGREQADVAIREGWKRLAEKARAAGMIALAAQAEAILAQLLRKHEHD